VSYTLRGRVETRLAALLPSLAAACVIAVLLSAWWPLEIAALMTGVGLALDVAVYHRLLPYQPGWLAVPLGLVELGLLMVLVRDIGIGAPLVAALAFFAGSWLLGQALVHAVLPLGRLSYAEDGGELGRAGALLGIAATVVLAGAGGFAWSTRPPVVHLGAGEHIGPIVLDHRQKLVGDERAIVRGGIVITASDVTVEGVTVIGGENGITVENARDVLLKDVTVLNARLDGIHVRRSTVTIEGCRILSPPAPYTQGIDLSFSMDMEESHVMGCTIEGGAEGIVTHSMNATLMGNKVSRTTLRAIDMTEMSMGMIEGNQVIDTLGIGIFCGDHSECMVEKNSVVDTRPDTASEDLTRSGYGIVSHYGAVAELAQNALSGSRGAAAFADGRLVHRDD
jgi:parallel beta helix pectate lyase-like protein